MSETINKVEKENYADILSPGMTVKVHEQIKDIDAKGKERTRIQIFEGIILALKKPRTQGGTMTVRKISEGIGVEKIFPLNSPLLKKIIPVKQALVRRAKLYYLRNYKKKLKEKKA
ncbi:MAG: 50S ribosomal protein L19 [Patescibacteria group bacterium]